MLAAKKLNKVAHAKVTNSDGKTIDGRNLTNKISTPVVIKKINNILEHNPGLLEEWQTMALSDILGRTSFEEEKFIQIDGDKLQKSLIHPS